MDLLAIWRFSVIFVAMEARNGVKGLHYINWPSAVGRPEHHRKAQDQGAVPTKKVRKGIPMLGRNVRIWQR